jgi:branched-chain amino acid transport system substrate-binding protein
MGFDNNLSRRNFLAGVGAAGLATFVPTRFAIGQQAKLKVGVMLPYTGTYAPLGKNIDDAMRLAIVESGGLLGGREVEFVTLDDESDPAKGAENANKLVTRDKIDVLIGTVHSGVAMAMVKIARDNDVVLIIPNAGANAATNQLCAPNIFRTSFSNWQLNYPLGKFATGKGHKRAVTLTWKYAAGEEQALAFKEGFEANGGTVERELYLPFPNVEFQPLLTEIAAIKPDVVWAFFAGAGSIKFLKDFHAAGLRNSMELIGAGVLTDGTLAGAGEAAQGIETSLHYGDQLDLPRNHAFREAFQKASGRGADVYAVQGYDTGQLLVAGFGAVKGDTGARAELIAAMQAAEIDSPRGKWTMSRTNNPIQAMYRRKVIGLENVVTGVIEEAIEDPATACKMA